MSYIKRNWSNIVILMVIALLAFPQTRLPIQVFVQRLISFSPSEVELDERSTISDYHWNLKSTQGDIVSFKRAEGKVSLVNFWATWCPPCIAEMPSFQRLYERYGNSVQFYFVSSENPSVISNFLKKKGYTFPVYIQLEEPPSYFAVPSIPKTYLISASGEIVVDKTGVADWDTSAFHSVLDQLLSDVSAH